MKNTGVQHVMGLLCTLGGTLVHDTLWWTIFLMSLKEAKF